MIIRSVSSSTIHYGQNLYQHQSHDYGAAGERDGKTKSHSSKMERDEVLPFHSMNQSAWNPSNGADYSSHLLSATLPISIQHILKYSESIKKETSGTNNAGNMSSLLNTGSDLLGLKNSVGSNLISNVASMVNQHHLNHHQHHNFINGNDNNMEHHHSSSISIPNHNSMLLNHNQNGSGSGINMKSPTMVPIGNSNITTTTSTKAKKERKKSNKQANTEKKPKKKKPPKERKPRPKPGEIREKTALDGTILYCCVSEFEYSHQLLLI